MPARASGSQPLHMQPFLAASKQNLRTQGKHPRAALPGGSVAHKRDERPAMRCRHGDEPGRARYGYARDSPRAPRGAAASRPLANGYKRTEAGPCTWSAPPSPSARFLDGISANTPRGRADDGAEASGLRRRPVGRRALGQHLATPLTGLRACTQPCVACESQMKAQRLID